MTEPNRGKPQKGRGKQRKKVSRKPPVPAVRNLRLHGAILKSLPLRRGDAKDSKSDSKELMVPTAVPLSLMDPGRSYLFRIVKMGTQQGSNGSGVIAGYASFDPAADGYSEWSALTSLFALTRIRAAEVHFIPFNPHADGYATGVNKGSVNIGTDLGLSVTTPASRAAVIDSSDSHIFGMTRPYVHKWTNNRTLDEWPFADITTTYSASNITGGNSGEILWYGDSFSNSTAYYDVMKVLVVELRCRT